MRIDCTEMVELPFMLNIPSGIYAVGGAKGPYELRVDQEQVIVHLRNGRFAICSASDAKQRFGGQVDVAHWQPLRTLVAHMTTVELAAADLRMLDDEELHGAMQSTIIRDNPTAFAGRTNDLRSEATRRLSEMNKDERSVFHRNESVRKFAKVLADPGVFVANLNRLIRLYMAQLGDIFVEEVTLHQLARGTPLTGVFTYTSCDGKQVGQYGHVGKVPPMMFKPWHKYPDPDVLELERRLEAGQQPDAIDLMTVRSRNCLEKGAFRSAIVEASAVLDLSVSSKIREGLRAKGQKDADIDKTLREPANHGLDKRAKEILRRATGQTAPSLDNTLWSEVSRHRMVIRQGVTHGDAEPDEAEATKVVNDFLQLAGLIRRIPVARSGPNS